MNPNLSMNLTRQCASRHCRQLVYLQITVRHWKISALSAVSEVIKYDLWLQGAAHSIQSILYSIRLAVPRPGIYMKRLKIFFFLSLSGLFIAYYKLSILFSIETVFLIKGQFLFSKDENILISSPAPAFLKII